MSVWQILPFFQLEVSFVAELIAPFFGSEIPILAFCMFYPIIIGLIQLISTKINESQNLYLDMIGEANSLFYAALPYKMIYLNLDSIPVAIFIFVIKIIYKFIGFFLVGWIRYKFYNNNQSENETKREEKNDDQMVEDNNPIKISQNISKKSIRKKSKDIINQNRRNRISSLSMFSEPVNSSRSNPSNNRLRSISNLKKKVEDKFIKQDGSNKMFSFKFVLLEIADLSSNICIFVLLFFDLVFRNILLGEDILFEKHFRINLMYFTIVRKILIKKVEFGIDAFYLYLCTPFYMKWFIKKGLSLHHALRLFFSKYCFKLILSIFMLFYLAYYVIFERDHEK